MGRFTIELKSLRFFAEHGMYQEEMKVGNEFELDISIECNSPKKKITSIEQTINYVEVYRIVQEEFATRRSLLETLATDIAGQILERFSLAEIVFISIRKVHAPVSQLRGSVGVSFELNRKDL